MTIHRSFELIIFPKRQYFDTNTSQLQTAAERKKETLRYIDRAARVVVVVAKEDPSTTTTARYVLLDSKLAPILIAKAISITASSSASSPFSNPANL